tara:strand:+ start:3110 stop:3301 length:192 start_codon:yes stop_codon:yes gene_type:complete
MENQELNKAIAYLADKVSKYHARLLSVERDMKRHLKECNHHSHDSDPTCPICEGQGCECQQST